MNTYASRQVPYSETLFALPFIIKSKFFILQLLFLFFLKVPQ